MGCGLMRPPVSALLWAMAPDALSELMSVEALHAMLPDALVPLFGRNGSSAASVADPIREGTTLIIPIAGVLAPGGMYAGAMPYELIVDRVLNAAAESRVGAIILDIRSPGGTVWGCAEAADAIYEARAVKPVIAVASPYCFSAAYWLATQAGGFFATKSGDVGSVGVRSGHVDISGFESKIGMVTTLIASSADKIAAHPHAPLSETDRADIQASVAESDRAFVRAIARGRGLRYADVGRIHGNGKTFSARRAHAAGAIDGIASLRDVVSRYSSSRTRLDLMRRQSALRGSSLLT